VETNWYVLTGGPSAGKTSLLTHLALLGHRILPEVARYLIDVELSRGSSIQAIRANDVGFQRQILELKVAAEQRLPPHECIFLDRGLPDTLAYCRALGIDETASREAVEQGQRYRAVFLLELGGYAPDYARTESADAAQGLTDLLEQVYAELDYPLIHVPWMPLEQRAAFILHHLS
jgi:predicted ATPase